jgi:hypothetical protein
MLLFVFTQKSTRETALRGPFSGSKTGLQENHPASRMRPHDNPISGKSSNGLEGRFRYQKWTSKPSNGPGFSFLSPQNTRLAWSDPVPPAARGQRGFPGGWLKLSKREVGL